MTAQFLDRRRGTRWWVLRIFLGGIVLVLILGLVIWIAGSAAKSNLVKQYSAPGRLVDVGGYKMHINCIGQGGPTVILDAGLGDFSIFWALVQSDVAKFTRVCAYDRAGYGWSEPSPYPRTSGTLVKELHMLLVSVQIQKPYVMVGHSFGGVLARLYAHNYPEEVVGMVLVDSAHDELFSRVPAWRKTNGPVLGLFRILGWLNSLGILALWPETIPNRGLSDGAAAQYRAIVATTKYYQTSIAENEAFEMNLAEVRAAHITSLEDLPLVVISNALWKPLFGIPGISDAESQQAQQAWRMMQSELVALSSNSKQIIAERSDHFIQLQQPELVVESIRSIVQANPK